MLFFILLVVLFLLIPLFRPLVSRTEKIARKITERKEMDSTLTFVNTFHNCCKRIRLQARNDKNVTENTWTFSKILVHLNIFELQPNATKWKWLWTTTTPTKKKHSRNEWKWCHWNAKRVHRYHVINVLYRGLHFFVVQFSREKEILTLSSDAPIEIDNFNLIRWRHAAPANDINRMKSSLLIFPFRSRWFYFTFSTELPGARFSRFHCNVTQSLHYKEDFTVKQLKNWCRKKCHSMLANDV